MQIEQLLNSRAKSRLLSRAGESGLQDLTERWERLADKLELEIIAHSEIGLYSALLTVLYQDEEAILKICTLPGIFSGQEAALRLAPPGSVPRILASFPEEEAWLLEKLPGQSGKSGQFLYQQGISLLKNFHQGSINKQLFDLVAYHMEIAKRTKCCVVLEKRKHYIELNQEAPSSLVHGDALPENILIGEERMWLIDPTGYKGDPAFDFATLALYSQDPLISLESACLSFARERIFAWAWLRAQLSYQQAALAQDDQGVEPLLELLPDLEKEVSWI